MKTNKVNLKKMARDLGLGLGIVLFGWWLWFMLVLAHILDKGY